MDSTRLSTFTYLEADETLKERVGAEWSEKAARHLHLKDGFAIVVSDGDILVGLLISSK